MGGVGCVWGICVADGARCRSRSAATRTSPALDRAFAPIPSAKAENLGQGCVAPVRPLDERERLGWRGCGTWLF